MTQQKHIGERLENWGRWCNSMRGARAADSMTAVACRRMSDAKTGNVYDRENGIEPQATPEDDDAMRIELAMRVLCTQRRLLLKWCYVEQARPEVVCRMVGLPTRPISLFVDAFMLAQAEIEEAVDTAQT